MGFRTAAGFGDVLHDVSFDVAQGRTLCVVGESGSGKSITCQAILGREDELAHSSIRFTIGRFTTQEEVDFTIKLLHEKIGKLRELSPLWEMFQDGVDLNTVQWAAH